MLIIKNGVEINDRIQNHDTNWGSSIFHNIKIIFDQGSIYTILKIISDNNF